MKNIIFILLILPFTSFSQIGIKAGYITKGYNVGIIYDQPFSEKENIFFDAELLYSGTMYVKDHTLQVDNNGTISNKDAIYGYSGSIQVPFYLKSKLRTKLSPIISGGLMPEYNLKDKVFTPHLLIGTGLSYKRFTLDARYLIEIAEKGKSRVNVSLSAILFKK